MTTHTAITDYFSSAALDNGALLCNRVTDATITTAGWAAANDIDAICDFAADATIGPDAAASNATYYGDGTHPTAAAAAIMEPIYRTVINAL